MPAHTTNPADYTTEQLHDAITNGARLVIYPYCVSLLIVTFRRNSRAYLIPAGHSALVPGLPWALLSLLLGWWGIPWGFIYTPVALVTTLAGGKDITDRWTTAPAAPPPLPPAGQTGK